MDMENKEFTMQARVFVNFLNFRSIRLFNVFMFY